MRWFSARLKDRKDGETSSPGGEPILPGDALRRLRLEASQVADGVMSGFHASARLGRGIEFAGFRSYVPGDDLRFLDRRRSLSDTGLLVRQYAIERDRQLLTIVDGSASMGLAPGLAPGLERGQGLLRKRRWADVLAAALVRIAAAQGDAACAATIGQPWAVSGFFRGKKAFERATEVLQRPGRSDVALPRSDAAPEAALAGAIARVARGAGWVVLLSDFLDERPPLMGLLAEARGRGAHVLAVRIEAPEERDFPFEETVHLRCPETLDRLETFGPAARTRYLGARAGHRAATTALLTARGISVVDACTDDQPARVLVQAIEALRRRSSAVK